MPKANPWKASRIHCLNKRGCLRDLGCGDDGRSLSTISDIRFWRLNIYEVKFPLAGCANLKSSFGGEPLDRSRQRPFALGCNVWKRRNPSTRIGTKCHLFPLQVAPPPGGNRRNAYEN